MKTTKKIYQVWWDDFACLAETEKANKALTFMNSRHLKRMNKGQQGVLMINEEDINYELFNKL